MDGQHFEQRTNSKHLQYFAFYLLTKDWPTHCDMMLPYLVLEMLEMLVDDLLEIRDMVSHAMASNTQNERQNKNGLVSIAVLKVI